MCCVVSIASGSYTSAVGKQLMWLRTHGTDHELNNMAHTPTTSKSGYPHVCFSCILTQIFLNNEHLDLLHFYTRINWLDLFVISNIWLLLTILLLSSLVIVFVTL